MSIFAKSVTSFCHAPKKVAFFSLLVMTSMAFTTSAYAISAYQADYKFKINKKYSGIAKRTLTNTGGNEWSYNLDAKVTGFASAKQESVFTEHKGKLKPSKHNIAYKILFAKITTHMSFDYAGKKVNVNHRGKKKSYAMPHPAQDALTLEMQVREDMLSGGLRPYYYIADRNKIKKMSFKDLGKQTLNVPAGSYDVVKLQLLHKDPKRKTFFYLSPKHDYLPIKIYQDDKGKVYDFQLKKLY